jgi:hypothetical protein
MEDKDRDRQPAVLPLPPDLDSDVASRKADRMNEKAAWDKHQLDFESLVSDKLIPFMEKHNLVTATIVSGLGTKALAKVNKHGFFTVTITKKQQHV